MPFQTMRPIFIQTISLAEYHQHKFTLKPIHTNLGPPPPSMHAKTHLLIASSVLGFFAVILLANRQYEDRFRVLLECLIYLLTHTDIIWFIQSNATLVDLRGYFWWRWRWWRWRSDTVSANRRSWCWWWSVGSRLRAKETESALLFFGAVLVVLLYYYLGTAKHNTCVMKVFKCKFGSSGYSIQMPQHMHICILHAWRKSLTSARCGCLRWMVIVIVVCECA